MLLAALTALAAQAATPPPAPTPPTPRPPVRLPAIALDAPNWALRRAPGSCAATVTLSGGARLLVTYHGGQDLTILDLVDPALGLTAGGNGQAILRFGALPEQRADGLVQSVTAGAATTLFLRLAPSRYSGRLRQLAQAGSITVTFGNRPPVTHEVPGAREGVPALLACAEEARNALPEAERLQRASLGSYFSPADYPMSSVENHESGTVRFWIEVSAQGRVTDCHIVQSSGSAALDAATCRVMRERARYAPARDANGRPVASYDGDYTLNWRL